MCTSHLPMGPSASSLRAPTSTVAARVSRRLLLLVHRSLHRLHLLWRRASLSDSVLEVLAILLETVRPGPLDGDQLPLGTLAGRGDVCQRLPARAGHVFQLLPLCPDLPLSSLRGPGLLLLNALGQVF